MTPAAFRDRYGLPLSTRSQSALEYYNQGIERILSFGAEPAAPLREAIAEDPDFALAHAALALTLLREMRIPEARAAIEQAAALTTEVTRRERQHVAALAESIKGRGQQALAQMREHLAEYPLDALILNALTGGLLYAGRQHEMVQISELTRPHYPADDWFSLGVHAFALQDVERFVEARAAAERALAVYRSAGFASHALAHVFYEIGDHDAGIDFLPGWLAAYDRRAGLYLHIAWHLALFHLQRGEYSHVLDLYEREIRPEAVPIPFQLFDPVSVLWRLDAYACPVEERFWQELGRHSAQRALPSSMIFNDLHHGMALARIGDVAGVQSILDSLRARGARGQVTATEVAVPLLQGLAAFAGGEYATAADLIEPIEDRIYEVGGSHAQREVFHETLIEALLKAGRFDAATVRLRQRLNARPSPRDFYRLSTAQAGTGEHETAAAALAEARARWRFLQPDAVEAQALRG